jgi:hypothetical protein
MDERNCFHREKISENGKQRRVGHTCYGEKATSHKKLTRPYRRVLQKTGESARISLRISAAKLATGAWVGKGLRNNHLGYFILRKRCSKTYRFPCSPK